jgi:hypothetical protein
VLGSVASDYALTGVDNTFSQIGGNGAAGQDGNSVAPSLTTASSGATFATGGNGGSASTPGTGGNGSVTNVVTGSGTSLAVGTGGAGGTATSVANATNGVTGVTANATSTGGNGGNTSSTANAATTDNVNPAIANAFSTGGQGGSPSGVGGTATSNANAFSASGGPVGADAVAKSFQNTAQATANGTSTGGGSGTLTTTLLDGQGNTLFSIGDVGSQASATTDGANTSPNTPSVTAAGSATIGSPATSFAQSTFAQNVSTTGPISPFSQTNPIPDNSYTLGNLMPTGLTPAFYTANPAANTAFNNPGGSVIASGLLGVGATGTISTPHTYTSSLTFTDAGANAAGRNVIVSVLNNGSSGYSGASFGSLEFYLTETGKTGKLDDQTFSTLANARAALTNVNYNLGTVAGSGLFDVTANLVFDTSSFSGFQTSMLFGYSGTSSVPEPASWLLFGSGLPGLGFLEMQRRRKQARAAKGARGIAA